jgi:histidine triad (HIT) family protein
MSDSPSLFTKIISGEIPGRFVWRDDDVVAFLTIAPIRPGHVLVVPIEQTDKWTEVTPSTWARASEVAQVIARVLDIEFECDRVGVMVAGLEVPHCHIHLVPIRTEGDLSFAHADNDAGDAALDDAATRIRIGLAAAGHSDRLPDSD